MYRTLSFFGNAFIPAVLTSGLMALASAQSASDPLTATPTPITGPIKNAGTFHVATGTWTRPSAAAARFGLSDNIYSNTAGAIYFSAVTGPTGTTPGATIIDEGVIPSTANPAVFSLGGATQDVNHVTSLEIGYCDLETTAGISGWTFEFYESYAPCTFPPPAPVGTVALTSLPTNGCWFLNIDLVGSSQDFTIAGDGGVGSPVPTFGIGITYAGTGTAAAGPFIAGDPNNTDPGFTTTGLMTGSNTYYGQLSGCPGTGSGYLNSDFFWLEDTLGNGAFSNCFFFGGYSNSGPCGSGAQPYGAFFLEMSDSGVSGLNVISQASCTGANNDTGAPGAMEVLGSLIPADNIAILRTSNLPANQMGIFIGGLAPAAPGAIAFGNGFVCIDPFSLGGIGRFNAPNQVKDSGPNGIFTLDTTTGEWNLASIPTAGAPYAALAGVTSYFAAWHREASGAGFNFSSTALVTWQ